MSVGNQPNLGGVRTETGTVLLTIPEAAAKYDVPEKRLRGAVSTENQTGRLDLPIGDAQTDRVVDDWRLHKLVAHIKELQLNYVWPDQQAR